MKATEIMLELPIGSAVIRAEGGKLIFRFRYQDADVVLEAGTKAELVSKIVEASQGDAQ